MYLGGNVGDIEVNAFIRHQARIRSEWKSRSEVESKIQSVAKLLSKKQNTVFGEWWLKRSDFQAHIERIADYIDPYGTWWHIEEGNVIMHDAEGKDYLYFFLIFQKRR